MFAFRDRPEIGGHRAYLADSVAVILYRVLGVHGRRFNRHRQRPLGKRQVLCRKPPESPSGR